MYGRDASRARTWRNVDVRRMIVIGQDLAVGSAHRPVQGHHAFLHVVRQAENRLIPTTGGARAPIRSVASRHRQMPQIAAIQVAPPARGRTVLASLAARAAAATATAPVAIAADPRRVRSGFRARRAIQPDTNGRVRGSKSQLDSS